MSSVGAVAGGSMRAGGWRWQELALVALGAVLAVVITMAAAESTNTALLIAGIPAGIGVIVLAVRFPFAFSIAFVALSYFRIPDAYPFLAPLRLPLVLGSLTLASVSWGILRRRNVTPFLSEELGLFLAFFLLVTIGIITAREASVAADMYTNAFLKTGFMAFAIAWLTRSPRQFAIANSVIAVSGALIALVAIRNKIFGLNLVEGTRVAIGGLKDSILGDPNDLAVILLLPLAQGLAMALTRGDKRIRAIGAVCSALTLLAIIFTQSRGALLGILAITCVIGLQKIRSKALLVAIAATLAIGLFVAMGISERKSGGLAEIQKQGLDDSSQYRIYAWQSAVRMAVNRPLTGVGLGNFDRAFYCYTPVWFGRTMAPHSSWFQVLGEVGFVGLNLFIAMILAAIVKIRQCTKRVSEARLSPTLEASALGLYAGLISFCVSASFLSAAFGWQLYIMVALTAALDRVSRGLEASATGAGTTGG